MCRLEVVKIFQTALMKAVQVDEFGEVYIVRVLSLRLS